MVVERLTPLSLIVAEPFNAVMPSAAPCIIAASEGSIPGAASAVIPVNATSYVMSPLGATAVTAMSAVNFISGRSIAGIDMPSMLMVRPIVVVIDIVSFNPAATL